MKNKLSVVPVLTRLGDARSLEFNNYAEADIVISMLGGNDAVVIGQNNHISIPVAGLTYVGNGGAVTRPVLSPTIPVTGCAIVHRVNGAQIDNYKYDNLLITTSIIDNYWRYGPAYVAKKMVNGMSFQQLIDIVGYEKFSKARAKVARHIISERFLNLGIETKKINTFLRASGM